LSDTAGVGTAKLEDVFQKVWRLLGRNPALAVPPVVAAVVNFCVFLTIVYLFFVQSAAAFEQLSWRGSASFYAALTSLIGDIGCYAVTMLLPLVSARTVVLIINNAGWGLMMARTATTGETSLRDYLEGVVAYSPRLVLAWLLQSSLASIPVLGFAVILLGSVALDLGSAFTTMLFMFGLPLTIVVECAILVVLWMWRPACFIDDVPVVEAFRRSISFVSSHLGDIFAGIMTCGLFMAVLIGLNASFQWLLAAASPGASMLFPVVVLSICVKLISLAAAFAICAYFNLFFNVIYCMKV
jgi:hypothetical protein